MSPSSFLSSLPSGHLKFNGQSLPNFITLGLLNSNSGYPILPLSYSVPAVRHRNIRTRTGTHTHWFIYWFHVTLLITDGQSMLNAVWQWQSLPNALTCHCSAVPLALCPGLTPLWRACSLIMRKLECSSKETSSTALTDHVTGAHLYCSWYNKQTATMTTTDPLAAYSRK